MKRTCILLRGLHPLADDGAFEARSCWRIIQERTRDQSYRLAPNRDGLALTGDREVDALCRGGVRRLRFDPQPEGTVHLDGSPSFLPHPIEFLDQGVRLVKGPASFSA